MDAAQGLHFAFQSTPPVKAATIMTMLLLLTTQFQSTPPVKAATFIYLPFHLFGSISIHAAREGGDNIYS